jgi:CxxC motif-containing protein (DUF1111 family)
MRSLRVLALLLSLVMVVLPLAIPRNVEGQIAAPPPPPYDGDPYAPEAPAGFDNLTNGFVPQGKHDDDRATFKTIETEEDGLGPTFNRSSCNGCHSIPVTGGVSTITELRAGHLDANGDFVPATAYVNLGQDPILKRSLINEKATCPAAEETLLPIDDVRALRLTTNLLGDGFVEVIGDDLIDNVRLNQPDDMQGQRIIVAALEGGSGIGRFGWKDQHVSLLSFASDAYLNEMGISNQLSPNRHDFTHVCDPDPADPEDTQDIQIFARFIRATKTPPRDETLAATIAAKRGEGLFKTTGCAVCHHPDFTTADFDRDGSPVDPALAHKRIHPYSDFLLHNIGTGDGIVQDGSPQNTRKKIRTAPLWGLRTHQVFLHDGSAASLQEAIQRHDGQALGVTAAFNKLTITQQQDLITFLTSL